jgi:hypothetical protein
MARRTSQTGPWRLRGAVRRRRSSEVCGAVAVSGALAALALSAGVGVAAPNLPEKKATPDPKPHGVLVDRRGLILRVFTDAKCSVAKNGFTATSRKRGARLLVRIQPFDEFGRYELKAGTQNGRYVSTFASFTDSSGHQFASNFVPPYSVASGGAIQFGQGGQLIGVGFEPTFNASGSEAIIFTGVMKCHYAKKVKR